MDAMDLVHHERDEDDGRSGPLWFSGCVRARRREGQPQDDEANVLCGHTRNHPEVQQEPEYTLWGWIMLSMLGMTPSPERVVFRCIRCKQSSASRAIPRLLHKKQMPSRDDNAAHWKPARNIARSTER